MSPNEHHSYLNHQLKEARHNLELARINLHIGKQEAPEALQSTINNMRNYIHMRAAQSHLHQHHILRLYDATYGATIRSLETRVRHCRNLVELRERNLREAGAAGGGSGV